MMMRKTQITKIMRKARGLLILGAAFLIMCTLAPQSAYADCSDPPGVLGQIIMNDTHGVPAYCDNNDQWIAMSGGADTNYLGPTYSSQYYVFVSEPLPDGNLLSEAQSRGYGGTDGVLAADYICQNEAEAADLPGTYFAWLSGPDADNNAPADRFFKSDVEYVMLDAPTFTKVADNWNDLTNGDLDNSIQYTAVGTLYSGDDKVWTNVNDNGTPDGTNHCLDWTSASGGESGRRGDTDNDDGNWTDNGSTNCDEANMHLYCFQQPNKPTATQIVPTGLVSHWRLDEETGGTQAYDETLGVYANIGLAPSLTAAKGIMGNAYVLNDDYYISAGSNNEYALDGSWSISVWAKTPATGTERYIAMKGATPNRNYTMVFLPSGQIRIGYDNGTAFAGRMTDDAYDDNEWHHIVGVFVDATNTLRIYVDGEQVPQSDFGSAVGSEPSAPLGTNLRIFSNAGNASRFVGMADDFRLYNTPLSVFEVNALYKARDGIRYNKVFRTYEYFDSNQFVSMTAQPPDVDEGPIYGGYPNLSCPTPGNLCSDGSYYVGLSPDGNVPMYVAAANEGIMPWNNGNSTGTFTYTAATPCDENGPGSVISTCNTGESNTATIIATDSDSSSPGTSEPHQAAQACADSEAHTNDDWYLPSMEELWLVYNLSGTIGGFPNDFYWSSSEDEAFNARRINFANGAASATNKDSPESVRCVRKADNPIIGTGSKIGHWKLNELIGTTAADETGSFNGTMLGGMTGQNNFTRGAVETAFNFDGIDDRVNMGDIFDFGTTQNFTISAWMKGTANSGGIIASKRNGGVGWWIGLDATNGNLDAQFDYGPVARAIAANDYRDDTWHLITATYDRGGDLSLYVDGVLEDSVDISGVATSLSTAQSFVIGSRNDGGTAFFGQIDDVRVYDYVLQPEAIAKLYLMGTPEGTTTALPQGCPAIGDVCDDGSIYAGTSPDGGLPMFAAAEDEGTAQWASFGTSRSTNNDNGDGNTITLYAFGPSAHPHAYNCLDKVAHGASDWYWPAQNELDNLYNGGNPIGNIITDGSRYWSSTQHDTNSGRAIQFNDGNPYNVGKNGNFRTRCVRKGPAPRCANPYGLEGQMIYNTTEEVVQFCDGARWIAIGKSGSP